MTLPVVGVDGGGTGSRALVLGAEGEVLARVEGSAAIVTPGQETASLEALRDLVRRALQAAGLEAPIPMLVAGLAGVGREADRTRMEALLRPLGLASRVVVRNDAEVAHFDAFGADAGILLIGGTGSIALAHLPSGATRRVGGWGAAAGDEGSGWWIGVGAVRATLQALDGRGSATALSASVTAHFGTPDPSELIDRLRVAAKGEVAALAPAVARAAEGGDKVAVALLDEAAAALVAHLPPLLVEGPIPVALLGGLVAPGGPLRSRVLAALETMGVPLHPHLPDPTRGAARLGLARLASEAR